MRNSVQIDEANIHDPTTADCFPGSGKPSLLNETVDEDVQMRLSILMKLQNCDVYWCCAVLSAQIRSQLIETLTKMGYGVALDLFRLEREWYESLKSQLVSYSSNAV